MLLVCPSQLLAMGSKRRIWLPDVPPSSYSKFLSLPRPSCLSSTLCFPLSQCSVRCHAALQLGTVVSCWDERCNVVWAARLASEPLREITLMPGGVAVSGKDGGWLCSSDLLTYMDSRSEVTPESQCVFSTNTRQRRNSCTLSEHQDFAHRSAIFQHQDPPSSHPP